MIHPNDIQEANEVLDEQESRPALPTIDEQIDAQRKLCYASDKAIQRLETELEFENARSVIRHDALAGLLNLRDLANAPHLQPGEHNAYPNGRRAAIPTGFAGDNGLG